jgi:hypothetical protein
MGFLNSNIVGGLYRLYVADILCVFVCNSRLDIVLPPRSFEIYNTASTKMRGIPVRTQMFHHNKRRDTSYKMG